MKRGSAVGLGTFRTDQCQRKLFFQVALVFKWDLRTHDLNGTQEKVFLAQGGAGAKVLGWGKKINFLKKS